MKLVWTVLSVVFQLGLAYFLFMGAVFTGCAMPRSGYRLSQVRIEALDDGESKDGSTLKG